MADSMKIALILDLHAPTFKQHIAKMAALLAQSQAENWAVTLQLWLLGVQSDELGAALHSAPNAVNFPDFCLPINAVHRIFVPHPMLASLCLDDLCAQQTRERADVLLFPDNAWGNELATRMAWRTKGSACVNVHALSLTDAGFSVEKAVYNNNLCARFQLLSAPYFLCAASSPTKSNPMNCKPCALTPVVHEAISSKTPAWFVSVEEKAPNEANSLADADCVLAVGQGVGSVENTQLFQTYASALSAEFASSRPVVMNGWSDISTLLGISGQTINPKLCLVAGASGSAAFLAGIANSEKIVAINTDPNAAIFKQADVGLVGDMNCVLPELIALLSRESQRN